MDIFKEQVSHNLNRKFFHGSKNGMIDECFKRFNCFFITTDFLYALSNAKDYEIVEFGKVFQATMKRPLNIFNPRSKIDKTRFLDLITITGEADVSSDIYHSIQKEDWVYIFKNTYYRDKFTEVLKGLGYDGWFNYEYSKMFNKMNGVDLFRMESVPSIGVFDIDLLDIKEADYKDFPEYKRQRKYDFRDLRRDAVKAIRMNKDPFVEVMDNLYDQERRVYLTLTENDVNEFMDSFDENEVSDDEALEHAKENHGYTGKIIYGEEQRLWREDMEQIYERARQKRKSN